MLITEIHLILQRPATDEEVRAYEYLQGVWDDMSPEERKEKGLSRITDLAASGNPACNVVKYAHGAAKYNDIFIQQGRLQIGVPGATEIVKRIAASMLADNRSRAHESFYIVGRIASGKSPFREIGFRTLIARTKL